MGRDSSPRMPLSARDTDSTAMITRRRLHTGRPAWLSATKQSLEALLADVRGRSANPRRAAPHVACISQAGSRDDRAPVSRLAVSPATSPAESSDSDGDIDDGEDSIASSPVRCTGAVGGREVCGEAASPLLDRCSAGTVRLALRLRPLLPAEAAAGDEVCVEADGSSHVRMRPPCAASRAWHWPAAGVVPSRQEEGERLAFDEVLPPAASQHQVR